MATKQDSCANSNSKIKSIFRHHKVNLNFAIPLGWKSSLTFCQSENWWANFGIWTGFKKQSYWQLNFR